MKTEDYKKQGGSAFPVPSSTFYHRGEVFGGLTRRQWYAGQALAGLMAGNYDFGGSINYASDIAKDAFRIADAMIAHEKQEDDAES